MAIAAKKKTPYEGPECPRCEALLGDESRRTGSVICPSCGKTFEATAFNPPQRRLQIVEVAHSGPEGANACANHERNTAVTSCQRCGLYICSLCDMNVGSGSYCPSCFDRVRTEGTLGAATTRFKDYGSMARVAAIAGFLFMFMFLGLPFGALTVYYARKGLEQAREDGRPTLGIRVAMGFGIFEAIAGSAAIVFVILGVMGKLK
jgi:ribosomal protein L37AE/L43A